MESAAAIPSVSVSLCISFSHHHLCQWELVPGKTIGREGCVCRRVCVHTCEDLITSVVEISKLVCPFLFLKLKKFSERNPSQKKEEKFNAVLIDCFGFLGSVEQATNTTLMYYGLIKLIY